MIMEIDGMTVEVIRRNIKRMYLYVRPPDGHLEVRAPRFVSREQITAFVLDKEDWIRKKQDQVREASARKKEPELVTGGRFPLWGVDQRVVVYHGARAGVLCADGILEITIPPDYREEQKEQVVDRWLRREFRRRIAQRLPVLSQKSGLSCRNWRIRDMKSRWGSCNTRTHDITLNLQLVRKDPVYLDYVILHELAHTRVPDHGPRFRALMDQICPEWKRLRKELNH